MSKIFIVLTLFLISSTLFAQNEQEKKVLKKDYILANQLLEDEDYRGALKLFLKIDSSNRGNANIHYFLGYTYLHLQDKKKSLAYLKDATEQFDSYNATASVKIPIEAFYYMGKACQLDYKLDEAIDNYRKYILLARQNGKIGTRDVENAIYSCEKAKEYIQRPVPVEITNLGEKINTSFPEYSPVISADESTLIFTSRRKYGTTPTTQDELFEDIYITNKKGGTWSEPVTIGENINSPFHEASVSLSADGQHLYIYKEDDNGSIYVCDLNGDEWSKPKKLNSNINTKAWEPSASISADNNYLYFVSDRIGGLGKRDIYKSKRLPDGSWGKAENLGSTINTPYDEDGPFIHPDGKTLYFSSNAPNGMGGFDIFRSIYNDSIGTWSTPQNLGYPINSTDDDIFFIISADGRHAYYSSVQPGGFGEKDLYIITLPETQDNASSLVLLTGNISIENNIKAAIDVNIVVTDNITKQLIGIYKPNAKTGKYLIILEPGRDYNIDYEAEDHLFASENISTKDLKRFKEIDKPISLKNIEVGSKAILKNIFFDFNKSELKPESQVELNKLYLILQQNPGMVIEISGHTDNKGNDSFNQKLSENRAEKVVEYLIGKGIEANRLKAKGYGASKPVSTNETEEGRQENRRIEYTILSL